MKLKPKPLPLRPKPPKKQETKPLTPNPYPNLAPTPSMNCSVLEYHTLTLSWEDLFLKGAMTKYKLILFSMVALKPYRLCSLKEPL